MNAMVTLVDAKHVQEMQGKSLGMMDRACGSFLAGDLMEAAVLWTKEANEGNSAAMERLARCFHEGWGVERDTAQAVVWFNLAAEHGDVNAMLWLGDRYRDGTMGVETDAVKAFGWFRNAAALGNGRAMRELALCFQLGTGVDKNDTEAVKWFEKAVTLGNRRAMVDLAFHLYAGKGVKKDEVRASALISRAKAMSQRLEP